MFSRNARVWSFSLKIPSAGSSTNFLTNLREKSFGEYKIIKFESTGGMIEIKFGLTDQRRLEIIISNEFKNGITKQMADELFLKRLSDYEEAADELLDITNRGKKGLVNRRRAERNIFKNNK